MTMPKRLAACLLLLLLAACTDAAPQESAPTTAVTPTRAAQPTETVPTNARPENYLLFATDAPSRSRLFTDINDFGEVVGFDAELVAALAARAAFEYEFVVTDFDGLLAAVAAGEFDAAIGGIPLPADVPPGIAFTEPYLEVGQVMVVAANQPLADYGSLPAGARLGVLADSAGFAAARDVLAWPTADIVTYSTVPAMLEALVNGDLEAVIVDDDEAAYYSAAYFQQLRIVGSDGGPGDWIDSRRYAIAVAATNDALLTRLNDAIATAAEDGGLAELMASRLTTTSPFNAGESLIGTLASELVIGVVDTLAGLDPSELPSPLSWEVKQNTMSGLFRFNAANELEPALAESYVISEDGLTYTFNLRQGLAFPDGRPFTAEDVRWSIQRASSQGNWLINAYLKDENEDGFADADSIQTLGELSLRIRLNEPTSYFTSLLATPPYAAVSQDCFPVVADPASTCGGIGPYRIVEWVEGERLVLQANDGWYGTPPGVPAVRLRFYESSADLRAALAEGNIDLAWSGLSAADSITLQDEGQVGWAGPAIFKSYLVLEQSQPPWDDVRVRQAAALAIDRDALAREVFDGTRLPLLSPVPDDVPGYVPVAAPRDLTEARALLASAGYSEDNPLEITLWYLNDGRYGPFEAEYAAALAAQLEETAVFAVTLDSASWGTFRTESATCNYPAYLLGWPPSGSPPRIVDPIDWMEYFITNTDAVCSNYESAAMDALLLQLNEANPNPTRSEERFDLYAQIQALWAAELPTIDLTQTPTFAVSVPAIDGVRIDALGLLRYDVITKAEGAP